MKEILTEVYFFSVSTMKKIIFTRFGIERWTLNAFQPRMMASLGGNMMQKKTKYSMLTAVGALAVAAVSNSALAQSSELQGIQLEELIITGIRGSLNTAQATKRTSSAIVDSIVAEDVGKFPDENVAESLQRVTGVTIDRGTLGGEGNSISIRGLGPNFSRVFINGRTVLNTASGRQVDFSDLPSEIVSRLDVFKTPMASLIEGSIGGSVDIKTASPFDGGGGFNASGSAQGVYSTLASEGRPRLSGQISNTFAGDTIGVLLGLQYQDRATRQDTYDVPGWECVDETLETLCSGSLEELPLEDRFFRPRFGRQFLRTLDSERTGVVGALHFRPNDNAKLDFDLFYSTRDDEQKQATAITGTMASVSDIDLSVAREFNGATGTLLDFTVLGSELRANNREIRSDNESLVVGVNGELLAGPWTFEGDIAYSEGSSDSTQLQIQTFREIDSRWDFETASGIPVADLAEFSANPEIQTGWRINNVLNELTVRRQDEFNTRGDITLDLGNSVIQSVQLGARYTDGGLDQRVTGVFENIRPRPTLEEFEAQLGVDSLLSTLPELLGVSDFGVDLPGEQIASWVLPSAELFGESAFFSAEELATPELSETYTIEEQTTAAYFQVNYDFGAFPLSGNFGVRAVETDIRTTGGSTVAGFLNEQEGSYSDVLPSLNARFDLVEDELLLRAALARTIARPSFNDLDPGTAVNVATLTGTSGNPGLDPFRADQLDLSLEWYFGGSGNILALTGFYKDVESFIQSSVVITTVAPQLLAGIDPNTEFQISQPSNGEGASVVGLELSYQQSFDMLPSPFDGLGILTNYTRLDTDAEQTNTIVGVEVGLEGLSENSYNVTAYYEKYGFSTRLAFNWRDEFLIVAQGAGGTPISGNAFGQLDATASYDINDHIKLVVEAKNINNENFRTFQFENERLGTYNEFGRRFFFGIRGSF